MKLDEDQSFRPSRLSARRTRTALTPAALIYFALGLRLRKRMRFSACVIF